MHTERQAYDALIRLANDEGRRGKKLYGYGIIPPRTGSEGYHIMIDCRQMGSASESLSA